MGEDPRLTTAELSIKSGKPFLTTKNTRGHEKGTGTQAFAVRIRRIQNQTSTSQIATLLLLIPPNSGRPDFVCRFIRRRATELQNWAVWFGVSTWSRQSQTAATEGAGILRDKGWISKCELCSIVSGLCAQGRAHSLGLNDCLKHPLWQKSGGYQILICFLR